jgi:6-phosphogluconolactonase
MTTYFYVASATTGDIGTYRLDQAAGRLEHVATAHAGGNLSAIAVSPRSLRLYAADRTAPGIVTFSVSPGDGTLSKLASTPAGSQLAYLSISADQRRLYGASYRDGTVCEHPVDADGIAGPAVRPPLHLGERAHCHAVVEDPGGELWVSALGHDLLYRVGHDPGTGELAGRWPAVQAGTGSGPRHLCVSPDRSELYVIGERDARITAHPLVPDGTRREWGTIPAGIRLAPGIVRSPGQGYPPLDPDTGLPYTWAADLAVSPDGRFVFSSERSSSTVSVTSARTGELLGWARTEEQPRGIAVDPSGQFLLATGELSATVSLYHVGAAGTLRLADRVPALPGLLWAEAAPLSQETA